MAGTRPAMTEKQQPPPFSVIVVPAPPAGQLCVEVRWLRRHRRLGLGDSPATTLFVSAPHFFTAERAERSAEGAEKKSGDLRSRWVGGDRHAAVASGPRRP